MECQCFSRKCKIVRLSDSSECDLDIIFFAPAKVGEDEYRGTVDVRSEMISAVLHSAGMDAAQAFFSLASIAVHFLMAQESEGYLVYWHEPGDLSAKDFWEYRFEGA